MYSDTLAGLNWRPKTAGDLAQRHRSRAFSDRGVSLRADLSFSCAEIKCASVTWLDAPMRESRDPELGGRT